ncbi:xanthine phosphoribosyltransferase [Peptoniphilus sp. KCTC 25270]|uniref:xanthine phosphoribosyltransferase n=1 Tax=Peptoniphilus sp. KCTC 25270 TaxID=2897414 RepID=UPI001E396F73|nr:xanthine phosphoribosyltransferase [Peptoniphilus sp. KCTC 25270]MCD1147287.1 xanthine phosphoribosyltransferase [Peptoniphilus sp. KCTC 25270]
MKLLEERIVEEGRVLPGNILKVDMFLNHQIDPKLFQAMGKEFYEKFKHKKITKVLTLEVSGIAIAYAAALEFGVPVLFAKKIESLTISQDVYSSKVISYTKNKTYDIRVDKKFLTEEDHVLIIDDFMANGEAMKGLINLCNQAGATVEAIGIAIEKTFQKGGKTIREQGYDIESLAMIKAFEEGKVVFEERD